MVECKTDLPAYAALMSLTTPYFVRKLAVSLGKGDKRGVDLDLGDCPDIARIHAVVQFNWSIRRFEVIAIGSSGIVVNGMEFALGSAPIPLQSGDLIHIPCSSGCAVPHEFHFLLAKSSVDRGPFDPTSYKPALKVHAKEPPKPGPWTASERERFLKAILEFGHLRPIMIRRHAELTRRSVQEISEFATSFMLALKDHASPGPGKQYLDFVLNDVTVKPLPETITQWRPLRKFSGRWSRRLRALHLLTEIVFLHEKYNVDVLSLLMIDMSNASSSNPLGDLVSGWKQDDDRALLLGAYKHGWTKFDQIRADQDLPGYSLERAWPETDEELSERLETLLSDQLSSIYSDSFGIKSSAHLEFGIGKGSGGAKTAECRSQMFTKRQRVDFMRALMIHGICRERDGKINWDHIRRRDGLYDKKNSSLIKAFQSFCEESARVAPNVLPTGSSPVSRVNHVMKKVVDPDDEQMSRVVAKKFRKRVALMHELRSRVLCNENLKSLMLSEAPPPATSSLPPWWGPAHDFALLQGIGIQGVGQWTGIFADSSLGWPEAELQSEQPRSEPLFNRARQLIKMYSAMWPEETIGPFDTLPGDFIDEIDHKRSRSDDNDQEEHAPKRIRINRQSMTIVNDHSIN